MATITEKFKKMGARLKIYPPSDSSRTNRRAFTSTDTLRIDVDRDIEGEYFDICTDVPLVVLDVDAKDKHLVLMARETNGTKPKFLCGFDERGWFVAALPEPQHIRWHRGEKPSIRRGISDVQSAKAALKPREVVESEQKKRLKKRKRNKRVNQASKRQGEWFFVPARIDADDCDLVILKNEPIQMGGKRRHMCEEVYRQGGETVWVNFANPNGITDAKYRALSQDERVMGRFNRMVRDAAVYARGKVTAPDHAPLLLVGWHKVIPNTENLALHGPRVAFLD